MVVLALLCLLFAFCRRRSTREKRLEEQNKAAIGQYANNIAQENHQKKKKGQVMTNLEDFPEQNIPMLNNLDPPNEPTRSESSSSDRVHTTIIYFYVKKMHPIFVSDGSGTQNQGFGSTVEK